MRTPLFAVGEFCSVVSANIPRAVVYRKWKGTIPQNVMALKVVHIMASYARSLQASEQWDKFEHYIKLGIPEQNGILVEAAI